MTISLLKLRENLSPMEQDFLDAETYACGVSWQEMLRTMIVEQAERELRDMGLLSATGDSQHNATVVKH